MTTNNWLEKWADGSCSKKIECSYWRKGSCPTVVILTGIGKLTTRACNKITGPIHLVCTQNWSNVNYKVAQYLLNARILKKFARMLTKDFPTWPDVAIFSIHPFDNYVTHTFWSWSLALISKLRKVIYSRFMRARLPGQMT